MWACALGHLEAAQLLYRWNSHALAIPDSLGRLPLSVARSRGHVRLATCLEELQRQEEGPPEVLGGGPLATEAIPEGSGSANKASGGPRRPVEALHIPSPLSASPDTGREPQGWVGGTHGKATHGVSSPSELSEGSISVTSAYSSGSALRESPANSPEVEGAMDVCQAPPVPPAESIVGWYLRETPHPPFFMDYDEYALYKKMTQAAILIQSKFRSYYEQKKFQQSRRAAVLIQQYYRSYKEYEKLKQGHRASAAMQQKIKGTFLTKKQDQAARKIMRFLRRCRHRMKELKQRQEVDMITLAKQIIEATPERIKQEDFASVEMPLRERPANLGLNETMSWLASYLENVDQLSNVSRRRHSCLSPLHSPLGELSFERIPPPPTAASWAEFLNASANGKMESDFALLTLSDHEQRELYEAAKIIQTAFRKYKGRRLKEQQEMAAAVIQRCYRKYKQAQALRHNSPAGRSPQRGSGAWKLQ
ncbi:hypothetical protein JD844_000731 [Phrynosoma platyrhinos]|uniref:Calmodulin-binding transcription activator 2 n=1 Tax=Phrynosoma platyrhinos TaxID=52577 RepID=A0ABQ7T921_PHRPL|nr:hypothetical protein JD844_000731 [Phrynosoma platyrhinos]